MGDFFQTKWGSLIKTLLGIILAYMLANGGTLATIGLTAWLGAISASFLSFVIKWLTGTTNGFFNTWYGSLTKTFVLVDLAYIVAHGGFVGLNWGALVNAGFVAVITAMVNAGNPNDSRFGIVAK